MGVGEGKVLPLQQPIANVQNTSIAVQTFTNQTRPATSTESKNVIFPRTPFVRRIFFPKQHFHNSSYFSSRINAFLNSTIVIIPSHSIFTFCNLFSHSYHSSHFTVTLEICLNHTFSTVFQVILDQEMFLDSK